VGYETLPQRFFSDEINAPDFSFGGRYPIPPDFESLKTIEKVLINCQIVTAGED
jgi:hypothetical protein